MTIACDKTKNYKTILKWSEEKIEKKTKILETEPTIRIYSDAILKKPPREIFWSIENKILYLDIDVDFYIPFKLKHSILRYKHSNINNFLIVSINKLYSRISFYRKEYVPNLSYKVMKFKKIKTLQLDTNEAKDYFNYFIRNEYNLTLSAILSKADLENQGYCFNDKICSLEIIKDKNTILKDWDINQIIKNIEHDKFTIVIRPSHSFELAKRVNKIINISGDYDR